MKGFLVLMLGLGSAGFHYFLLKLTEFEIEKSSTTQAEKKGLTEEKIQEEVEQRKIKKLPELYCFKKDKTQKGDTQKHVVVVGGGVVGVTTAYYLSRDFNYKVTLIEKEGISAASTSWGNAGVMDLTYDTPMASPSNIHLALSNLLSFGKNDSHFEYFHLHKLELLKDISFWKWSFEFVKKAYFRSVVERAQFLQAMKRYSASQFSQLLQEEKIEVDIKKGVIELYSSEEELQSSLLLQQRHSVDCESLNRSAVCEKEPILKGLRKSFIGGIYTPFDLITECPKFTRKLTEILEEKYNVTTRFNSEVTNVTSRGGVVNGVSLSTGEEIKADAVVLCTASDVNLLPIHNYPFVDDDGDTEEKDDHKKTSLEIRKLKYIPIFPMRGYSIRIPLSFLKPSLRPSSVIVKDHVYLSPINPTELNVASIGEFQTSHIPLSQIADNHISSSFSSHTFDLLSHSFLQQYRSLSADQVLGDRVWMGRRPLSADGLPIISKVSPGLFVNVGHGMYGWMLSCASGRIAATIVDENFRNGVVTPRLFRDYLFVERF